METRVMRWLWKSTVFASFASASLPVKALDVETVPGSVERILERVPGSPRTGGFHDVAVSADGMVVATIVRGPIHLRGLPPIPEVPYQVVLIDRRTGEVELVSRSPSGGFQNTVPQAGVMADWLSISDDGARVAFMSSATNLDPAATVSPRPYTYVYERSTRHVRAVDVGTGETIGSMGFLDGSGRRIAFYCLKAPNQPPVADQFGLCIRDLETFQVERVYSGGSITSSPSHVRFSGDGQRIYFGRTGPGLIDPWPNPGFHYQAYLYDVALGELRQVPDYPPSKPGPTGGFDQYAMPLGADGDAAAFGLGNLWPTA